MIAKLFWLFVAGILYTYAGYPLLLALLGRIWPKRQPYKPITPSVTLLIAAYNEEAVIAEKIKNSLALDYPRDQLQILVTADGSDDRTPDIVREYADARNRTHLITLQDEARWMPLTGPCLMQPVRLCSCPMPTTCTKPMSYENW